VLLAIAACSAPASRPRDAAPDALAGALADATGEAAMDAAASPGVDGAPGPDDAGAGPDLVVVANAARASAIVTEDTFATDDCEVIEACIGGPGTRRLLRFDAVIANVGTADLIVGPPPAPGVSDAIFVWSACHQHHHVRGFAEYALLGPDGGVVVVGRKQAFCVEDSTAVRTGATSRGYGCANQGISHGWADVYTRYLPCQWIDVTDVPSGHYQLRIRINTLGTLPERDVTNDEAIVDVVI
jgi:hypothetical protein